MKKKALESQRVKFLSRRLTCRLQEPKPEAEAKVFDPAKETKKEREARINAVVKKALEGITGNR